jgi:quercetin dioxygenase-like cupin family protein
VGGVAVKVLHFDEAAGRAPTILLKFDPGATYPAHNHPGGEEIYVQEGDIRLGTDHLRAGDYLYTAPSHTHGMRSEGGCIVLVVVPQEVVKCSSHARWRGVQQWGDPANPTGLSEGRTDERNS